MKCGIWHFDVLSFTLEALINESEKQEHVLLSSMASNYKPLVILVGWMGAQVSHLKRYKELYESLGCNAWTIIPPVATIVDYCSLSPQDLRDRINKLSNVQETAQVSNKSTEDENPWPDDKHTCMKSLAVDLVAQLDTYFESASYFKPRFLFHLFSNGGYFLWDQMQLMAENINSGNPNFGRCRARVAGIVFDSCPAYFGKTTPGLSEVIKACPDNDLRAFTARQNQKLSLQHENLALKEWCVEMEHNRALQIWNRALASRLDVPQLYLYSRQDMATSFAQLHKLVEYHKLKQSEQQKETDFVKQVIFDDSPHCQHYRKYPDLYKQSIIEFLSQSGSASCSRSIQSKV